jgi:hypothetical protein
MKDDKKIIKRLREQLKNEREDHERTRKERYQFFFDLTILRNDVVEKLAWYIDMLDRKQTPNLQYLIKCNSKLLNRLKPFSFTWPGE